MTPRTVDQPTFDQIECDRCGVCCEEFPFGLDNDDEWGFWRHHGPLGWLELYAYGKGEKVGHFAPMDSMLFYGQLEPTLGEDNVYRYRCGYFERDADGLGVCTVYDQRPGMCRKFPYGEPVCAYPECVWSTEKVTVLDLEPMWRLGIGERDCEPGEMSPDVGYDPASPYLQ
ncbi:hypothetical protein LCGC14_1240300 [marine sediment metagenome]|uniref:Uncharacterized protein n=1 Tax=marine sediment metagenome TaxID=412755 RepID=A0A0F9NN91_9ZZZZ